MFLIPAQFVFGLLDETYKTEVKVKFVGKIQLTKLLATFFLFSERRSMSFIAWKQLKIYRTEICGSPTTDMAVEVYSVYRIDNIAKTH